MTVIALLLPCLRQSNSRAKDLIRNGLVSEESIRKALLDGSCLLCYYSVSERVCSAVALNKSQKSPSDMIIFALVFPLFERAFSDKRI